MQEKNAVGEYVLGKEEGYIWLVRSGFVERLGLQQEAVTWEERTMRLMEALLEHPIEPTNNEDERDIPYS